MTDGLDALAIPSLTKDDVDALGQAIERSGDLAGLAKRAAVANAALRAGIVAERAKGRTLQAIADEIGWTKAGVLYVVRKAADVDCPGCGARHSLPWCR